MAPNLAHAGSMPDVKQTPDFEPLTEHWGLPMPRQQISMAKSRYNFVAEHCKRGRLLEVGCGSGFGSEFLAAAGPSVVAGDLMAGNLAVAHRRVPSVPMARFDVRWLPFPDEAFDSVAALECLYYFPAPQEALVECYRVLKDGGKLCLSVPNPRRPGFHESPHAVRYFDATELSAVLDDAGFDACVFGGFPLTSTGLRSRALRAGTRLARRAGLIPKDLRGRAWLKRLLVGKLERFDGLIDATIAVEPLQPVENDGNATPFIVLYGLGTKRPAA